MRRDGYIVYLNIIVDIVIERKVDYNLKENFVVENIIFEKDIVDFEMKVEIIYFIGEFFCFK